MQRVLLNNSYCADSFNKDPGWRSKCSLFTHLTHLGKCRFMPTQPVWTAGLTSSGNLLTRSLSVAASAPPIEVKTVGGAEGVQVVLFGWLGAQDKYLVNKIAHLLRL